MRSECSQRRSGRIRDSFESRLPEAFVVLAAFDYAWDTARRTQDVAPVGRKFSHCIEHALGGSRIALCYECVYVWQILLNDCGMTIDPRFSHEVGPRRVSAVSNPLPTARMAHRDVLPIPALSLRAHNLLVPVPGDILPWSEIPRRSRGFPSWRSLHLAAK